MTGAVEPDSNGPSSSNRKPYSPEVEFPLHLTVTPRLTKPHEALGGFVLNT